MAAWYWLSANCKLYRRSFGGLYLLCLHHEKVSELLTELHDEVCGSHVGGCLLAHRAMTQGFWWPQMQNDATEYVCKCEQCQKHAFNPSASRPSESGQQPLAFRTIGAGYSRPISLGNRQLKVCVSSC